MDAFIIIRQRLIAQYSSYVRSLINIGEPGIREHVQRNRREKLPGAGSEGRRLCLYRRQEDGIRTVLAEQNYVLILTIGAAASKSLSLVVPIVDPLRQGAGKAMQAIVVYRTDSQARELEKFLRRYPTLRLIRSTIALIVETHSVPCQFGKFASL
jgi:ATP-dependent helicase YprA (DUF1998 family)